MRFAVAFSVAGPPGADDRNTKSEAKSPLYHAYTCATARKARRASGSASAPSSPTTMAKAERSSLTHCPSMGGSSAGRPRLTNRRPPFKILTQELREKLLANGRQQQPLRGTDDEIDFVPVVKLFTPDAGATWLLTEIDPEDPDIAFGLSVRLSDLSSLRGRLGLPVEQDLYFRPDKPLSAYASEADRLGRIRA